MRLGLVFAGVGAHSAACIGVLEELAARQIEPYAVCALAGGAWPGALFGAGLDAEQMIAAARQAQQMKGRMMRANASARDLLRGKQAALSRGTGLQRLLNVQTGGRILALCPRRVVFPMRSAHSGNSIVFATRTYLAAPGVVLTLQATLAFAACAQMALAPVLTPMQWLGSPLFPMMDLGFAAQQLAAMGAQRTLIVLPQPSVGGKHDALELLALSHWSGESASPGAGVGLLRIPMPQNVGALSASGIPSCIQAGRVAAQRQLDRLFEQMGMAFCRVLPFRRNV